MGGVDGSAGGGVHLGGVVQFDDFGGFEVFRGLGGKVVGQYGGDREVRCDEDLLGFGLRTVGDGGFDLGEFLVGPAGGADHHVHALADQGQHVVQADGRHGEFDDHIGVVGGDLGQVVAGIQCERQLRILGVVQLAANASPDRVRRLFRHGRPAHLPRTLPRHRLGGDRDELEKRQPDQHPCASPIRGRPVLPGGNEDVPYDLVGYITEIDTGRIDADYMNSRFEKYMKLLNLDGATKEAIEQAETELHKTFATLSQEEQKYANIFLHDIQRGDVVVTKGKTFRDYITEYLSKAKDDQIHKIAVALGVDKFAQYSLGNLYYYGNGVERDLSQAFLWYQKSSSQGQPYASYSIAQMYNKGEYVSQSEENAQRYYKNALSGFLELESKDQADDNLYYKLGSMFKKGLGTDIDMDKAIDYFKRSAEMNNTNAKRTLALEYISGKHLELDIENGLEMLTECADSGDTLSCYKLGKIYFKGEIVYKDLNMAEKYLLKAAENKNEYALYSLGKLYLEENCLDKAVEYFDKAVQYDEIKPYAAYSLAKIMLDNNPYHDSEKALSLLESSAEDNDWASFLLGRLYLYGTDDIQKDKEKALEWLELSTEQGNEYAQYMLDNIHSFENAVIANTIFGLFVNLSRCIADDYNRKYKSNRMSADRKLRRIIQQKKQALGLKEEHLQNQELY